MIKITFVWLPFQAIAIIIYSLINIQPYTQITDFICIKNEYLPKNIANIDGQ